MPRPAFLAALVLFLLGPAASSASARPLLAGAPAFWELQGFAVSKPLMITIHGGGWQAVGPQAAAAENREAAWWRARGWATLNISYRRGRQSVSDVVWFYDQLRQLSGPGVPICASGDSAGAHLALMLAALRPALSCVLARGAPTDLASLARQKTWNPALGGLDLVGARYSEQTYIQPSFGSARHRYSPVHYAKRIKARVLLASSKADVLVPWAQETELARRLRPGQAVLVHLDPGAEDFVHGGVSAAALAHYRAVAARLVRPFERRTGNSAQARTRSG